MHAIIIEKKAFEIDWAFILPHCVSGSKEVSVCILARGTWVSLEKKKKTKPHTSPFVRKGSSMTSPSAKI